MICTYFPCLRSPAVKTWRWAQANLKFVVRLKGWRDDSLLGSVHLLSLQVPVEMPRY